MPIPGITQPELLSIDDSLHLRRFHAEENFLFVLDWYQDKETLTLVDGIPHSYDVNRLTQMYAYLEAHGELYWIELRRKDGFVPIGDVTFWQQDMPIVIGDAACRGQGIGTRVVRGLIQRGGELGYAALEVAEIYDFNIGSRRLFEGLGFQAVEKTEQGSRYRLVLERSGRNGYGV